MDIAELFGRSKSDERSELPEDFSVPDYPPSDDADASPDLYGDLLESDPAPRRDKRALRASGGSKKVTVGQKRQIQDALELMLITLGGGVTFRDPHCGGVLTDHAANIAAKATPLISRNPQWVEWFTGSTGFLDVMGLLIALRPVGSSIWGHHVSHTVDTEVGQLDLSQFTAPDL
jgi:hypothetical protein